MKKNTIIISSSLALLTVALLYSTLGSGEEEPAVVEKNPQPTQAVLKEEPKPIETVEKIEPAKVQESIVVKKVEEKKKIPATQYTLSSLPENMSIQEKKQRFNELLLPAIDKVYTKLENQYNETKLLIEQEKDKEKVQTLMKSYQAKDEQDLLQRLKPHPQSVAIAQSAMQSGWATSRFTLIANNLFGVWSFDPNEPRVQANEKRDGEAIFVKKYASLQASIEDYYKLLATSPLFEEFREQKMKTNDPYILIESLDKYYKEGDDFATGLNELIKYNKLEKYDK